MKKIIKYVFYILIVLSVALISIYLITNKNRLKNINSSIVYIESIDDKTITSGSGFVYKINNDKVYIITCYHVIEGYNNIYIYNYKKEKVKAEIVNYDEYTDIAILSIDNKLNLKEIAINNSDVISINDKVYAIGTPLNIENMNTKVEGVVLNKSKEITITTTHGTSNLASIEVNVQVKGGNSGGPLLDKNYKVIGMMFVKEETVDNKSYALPINYVKKIVEKLENKELNRPNLGATMCNTTNIELLNKYGIVVNINSGVVLLEVNEDGVLNNYGLQKGDVITKFNDMNINNVNEFRQKLYKKSIGDNVAIEYYRDGIYHEVDIEL